MPRYYGYFKSKLWIYLFSLFSSIIFCFMYSQIQLLGPWTFRIVFYSSWIDFFHYFVMLFLALVIIPCSEVYVTLPEVFMFYNIGLYFLAYGIKTELWLLWSETVKELSRLTMMNNSGKETRASWVQTRKQRLKCEAEMRKLRPKRPYDTQLVSDRARLVPHSLPMDLPSVSSLQSTGPKVTQ